MSTESPKDYQRLLQELPSDWWRASHKIEVLTGWFRRYLIGLFVEFQDGKELRPFMFSGFLLEYRNRLLWATAGHVIDQLIELLENTNLSIKTMRWADNYSVRGAESIPMHHRDLQNLSVSFTHFGIDFGFVFLIGLDRENILRNDRINIMSMKGWQNLQFSNPEGYYILGYPRQLEKVEKGIVRDGRVLKVFEAMPTCLPIIRIPYRSEFSQTLFWNDPDAFYGHIEPFSDGSLHQFSDIDGMSGGPILSIERTNAGEIKYRLFGIQRSWEQDEGIIRAEPIQRVIAHLDLILDAWEAFTEQDEL